MSVFDTQAGQVPGSFIRVGEVTDVDPSKAKVRVTFDDEDSLTSFWLPVLQRNTMANRDYWLPDNGEDVVCIFFGEGAEDGFILGSFYAGDVTPPENSQDKRTVVFDDETKVSYDRGTHELDVVIGSTTIHADRSQINIAAPDGISSQAKAVTLNADQSVGVSAGTSISLAAPTISLTIGATTMVFNGSSAELKSASLSFEGSVSIQGNLSVSGNISSSGNIAADGTVSGSNI